MTIVSVPLNSKPVAYYRTGRTTPGLRLATLCGLNNQSVFNPKYTSGFTNKLQNFCVNSHCYVYCYCHSIVQTCLWPKFHHLLPHI